jgi:hypothetical protein
VHRLLVGHEQPPVQAMSDKSTTSKTPPPAGGNRPPSTTQPTPAADNLGQEGVQPTIKPNTTNDGERQDRGP